jgi:septum site-determining protein MinC
LKNRQYSIKVFEATVEDEEKFKAFFETNATLFRDHLILINGDLSASIRDYLNEKSLNFIHNASLPAGRLRHENTRRKEEEIAQLQARLRELEIENGVNQQIATNEIEKLKSKNQMLLEKLEARSQVTVLDEMVRSGTELTIDGDLLLLNRVNSGATIRTSGNLIITQVVEGAVRCDGQFMMLTVSPKANIIFNGVEVENELLEDELNRIELRDREIFITPVIKKEINWA